jgi:hypothetical protein
MLPEEEGLPNEWQFEYVFGPEAHHPKDMLWLTTSTNYKADFSDRRVTSGRSVITKGLTSAYVDRFYRQWHDGAELGDSPRELTIAYKTPDTHDPDKKWPWQQGVKATFSMVNWDKAYHQLAQNVIAKGGMHLLLTVDVLEQWPISELPANTIKPPDDELKRIAKFLYMEMNELSQMSLYDLRTELMIEGYYDEDEQPAAPATMSDDVAKAFQSFRWPNSNCERPSFPSIDASESRLRRFNANKKEWFGCLSNLEQRDAAVFQSLVRSVGGSTDPESVPNSCLCVTEFLQLAKERHTRRENYIARVERKRWR